MNLHAAGKASELTGEMGAIRGGEEGSNDGLRGPCRSLTAEAVVQWDRMGGSGGGRNSEACSRAEKSRPEGLLREAVTRI